MNPAGSDVVNGNEEIKWEMSENDDDHLHHHLDGSSSDGPMIRVKVSSVSSHFDIKVPSQSTFGYLKKVLALQSGLEPQEQRLFFRGREKGDADVLHTAGVKDLSKLLLMEHSVSKERKMEELRKKNEILKACEAVGEVRAEVDKLSAKVSAIQASVDGGIKVNEKDFIVSTELLMVQLLKLDSIEAKGEAKIQRKNEVSRVQSYVDTLDELKARNSNLFGNYSNAVVVTTQWETFDSGAGSLATPPPMP
ncbi:hypothetical protein Nepgr_021578 [Nepenthes gracilis]|uniref:BAG family molecular chaperone regulator 4 n=1 Tax=Nepenthes gracilis TaxID=150966 RepID=A0AAD3XW21_NEPGR|nr:hypothetical protein Nepgr_021578 [Nepenthes gracilis]